MATTGHDVTEATGTASVIVSRGRGLSLRRVRDDAVIATILLLFVLLLVSSPTFGTPANLANVLSQCAIIGIMAAGVAVVFLAGEFDLSIGAIYAVAALIGAGAVEILGGVGGILAGVAAGAVMGLVNGLLVTVVRINAFMVMLATSFLIAGLGVILTQGSPVLVSDPSFLAIGQAKVLGLSLPVFIWIGVVLLLTVALQMTKFGRRVYAVGGNKEAARLSGVNVTFIKTVAFMISGACAAFAGVIAAAQVGAANPNAGTTLVLTTIAAVVIGGISIYGGEGAIWRAAAGVLLLVLINNGFNLLGLDALYAQVVQGAVILIAVGIDVWSGKARS